MSEEQPLLKGLSQGLVNRRGGGRKRDGYGTEQLHVKQPQQQQREKKRDMVGRMGSKPDRVRAFRRRRQLAVEEDESSMNGTVRATSTCSEFQLKKIVDHYRSKGIQVREKEDVIWLTMKVPTYLFDSEPDPQDAIFTTQIQPSTQWMEPQRSTDDYTGEREYIVPDSENDDDDPSPMIKPGSEYTLTVFFYSYGVIVWWSPFPPSYDLEAAGLPLLQEVARMRHTFEVGSLEKVELDTCRWTVQSKPTKEESHVDQDCFYLSELDSDIMLAYACGLAQSAKISEFEDKIEEIVEETKGYPLSMARTGSSELTRIEVSKIRGALFLRKMDVNLHTDILETPDVFWTRTDLEPLYLQARRYMEISHRTEVLNKRLEIVHELFEVFHEELNTNHSNYLEWIIIWLILVELILGLASALIALRNP